MTEQIEKLIQEYIRKIAIQQDRIDSFNQEVREWRKNDSIFYDSIDELLALRKGARALHQSHVQTLRELRKLAEAW